MLRRTRLAALARSKGVGAPTFDYRTGMPAGHLYTRTGAATGLALAGLILSFAADQPQRTDRGLALEAAATNLLIRSQAFNNTDWAKTALTAADNQGVAPDGTTTAALLDDGVTVATHFASSAFSAASGTTYRASFFFKNVTRRYVQIVYGAAAFGTNAFANFDLQSGVIGTVGSAATASIIALGNGWYRCTLSAPATATTSASLIFAMADSASMTRVAGYTGTNQQLLVWGAQVVTGSDVQSYIPTAGASATRGLPSYTEPVPSGRTQARLTYADGATTLVTGLTPGGTFDVASAVIGAGKGRFGLSELLTREYQP